MKLRACKKCGRERFHVFIAPDRVELQCAIPGSAGLLCSYVRARSFGAMVRKWNALNTPKKPRAARRSER